MSTGKFISSLVDEVCSSKIFIAISLLPKGLRLLVTNAALSLSVGQLGIKLRLPELIPASVNIGGASTAGLTISNSLNTRICGGYLSSKVNFNAVVLLVISFQADVFVL